MDELMNAGQILKKGNTCYVSAVVWNNRTIVIKRYNHKGWFHSLRHTLKRSRARRSWLYGHRMRLLGINTACPFIFVESRKNGLIWKSYIVNEYIDGQNIDDFSKSSETTDQQKKNTLNKTEALLNKLYRFRITHSDLKPSNILISNNAPFLIDLDSIQIHRSGLFIKKGYRKMLASFHNRLTGRKNNPPDKT
jgi:tRNA A-37 threonylcarbamoyl transferase component Bud32